jgi:LacI family transcriptional regulator
MVRKRREPNNNDKSIDLRGKQPVSLKELALHLGLSPTSLSLVLNNAPAAQAIPQETKERIFAAAREFGYRPNYLARSLRAQRSFTIGVLVPELSDGYSAMVLSGIEDQLLRSGFLYLVISHRHDLSVLDKYRSLLFERCVEGIIAVDTPCDEWSSLPVVAVSGHSKAEGVTNVVVDHEKAATLALEYLRGLGHRRIAFIKGQVFSSDTEVRWNAIRRAAARLNLPVNPELVAQMEGNSPSPEIGYVAAQKLLETNEPFTALFAFNDVSAIGAIRALHEAGLSVPADVSVVGFDDVYSAAFHNPGLTTVRQPLKEMGRIASSTLLQRIANGPKAAFDKSVMVEPELIVRESTGRAQNVTLTTRRRVIQAG